MPVTSRKSLARDLDDQLLQAAREAAHEGPVGVADHQLPWPQRPDPVVVVEERVADQAEVAGERVRRRAPDDLRRALDQVRGPDHPREVQRRQLQVDLGGLQRPLVERTAAQADQRIRVVRLPARDALPVRKPDRAEEPHRAACGGRHTLSLEPGSGQSPDLREGAVAGVELQLGPVRAGGAGVVEAAA